MALENIEKMQQSTYDEIIEKFAEGVTLADGTKCRPAVLKPIEKNYCEIKISEGRYHQIKRMFGCFGAKVTELHRLSMGGFSLPENLLPGKCRELTEKELALIEGKVKE